MSRPVKMATQPEPEAPITSLASASPTLLREAQTVGDALDLIRQRGVGERIIYFYVVDADDRLVGVVPTRRLLLAQLDQPISSIMVRSAVAIPLQATVAEACEFFILHRFLAFPVVDEERRVVGIVDVSQFTDEVFDLAEREQTDAVFEALGFRYAQVKDASPVLAFRFRFPWLLATITSGTMCAVLAGWFERTLAEHLVLAFFLTLVLGLAESVSMQSTTVTIQALRQRRPSLAWLRRSLRREVQTAALLGLACGGTVALIAWLWRGSLVGALVIGGGIAASLLVACITGVLVPWVLHRREWDPKVAAGPLTLAITDLGTITCYFSLATWAL
ncbi:MAG TPA: magnesium transporter [Gemmatales bacterium]|nr:magnesium transporter [Gemmatales bacterium]HMP60252.1 magnesium transporter [Gemmatales bacterium]